MAIGVGPRTGFELDGISPDGIGLRFVKDASAGPGRIVFDILVPEGLGALICKAAATTIATRTNPERDWLDTALALSILDNPRRARRTCDNKDRARLDLLRPLLDPTDKAWRPLSPEERDLGIAALEFLIS
jgi:hypothetical protein